MKIFAIGDLHFPGGDNKPMDVFGAHWEGHQDKIASDWAQRVREDDLVLVPGDISWAMYFPDALPDLAMIGALPGSKVLLRGNHDYWWPGTARLREKLPLKMHAVQNDAVRIGEVVVCGTRGWTLPGAQTTKEDARIFQRELLRLEMSLDRAAALGGRMVVMTHYPPVLEDGAPTPVSQIISRFAPEHVVYGHLHGASNKNAFGGYIDGVRYDCVACDKLGFTLFEL